MQIFKKIPLIITLLSSLTLFSQAYAEIKVVASIKPIHSLASYLMDGVKKPDLIVDGYASPHGFAMKPSHAKMLQEADIIFWVGEDLENFLVKPLGSIAKKAEKIELMEIRGLNKFKFRERNIFDGHDDHGHKEDDHDDHAKKEDGHDDHDHDKEGHKEDGHDDHGHEGHAHGEFDPHIWLDPMNAKKILKEMAKHLIENDQANESIYKENLKKANKDLDKLVKQVKSDLNKDFKSIVFHDALYRLEIRKKFREMLSLGFSDVYRHFNETKEGYTFWDYMRGAWQKNNGMRIDHFLVSSSIIDNVKKININKDPRGREKPSDHTPIEIELN